MKGYDYYRDAWPRIVAGCYDRGYVMYVIVTVYDALGKPVRYERGAALTRAEALDYRGETMEINHEN